MYLIETPMTFFRDYTCPMGEEAGWDRNRGSILPITMPLAFLWLYGLLGVFGEPQDDYTLLFVGLGLMVPGAVIGMLIRMKTKVSTPPTWLMHIYAFLCFIMSTLWIKFSSDCIMDLLQLFGYVT